MGENFVAESRGHNDGWEIDPLRRSARGAVDRVLFSSESFAGANAVYCQVGTTNTRARVRTHTPTRDTEQTDTNAELQNTYTLVLISATVALGSQDRACVARPTSPAT